MKSQANALLHVLVGILYDVQQAYPEMRSSVQKDILRITSLTSNRGQGLYTLDLPSLDPLLLGGLENGRLQLGGALARRVSRKCHVPRLFSGLWLRIFDADSCLKQEPDPTAIAFMRQIFCLGKRLDVECSSFRREAALEAYHEIEKGLRLPSLDWEGDEILLDEPSECISLADACQGFGSDDLYYDEEVELSLPKIKKVLDRVQQVADILSRSFGHLDVMSEDFHKVHSSEGIGFKHGPGAVASGTKKWERSQFPTWPHKLEHIFPFAYCGMTTIDVRLGTSQPVNHELASRMICVPKTSKAPRIIAAEPAEHQWCQQALWTFLRGQIKKTFVGQFIDFSRQDLSAELVVQASRDRKLATVDLSDASDRLTCWTMERIFRKNHFLLNALHAARTRYLRHIDGSFLKLRKFASQGTATTFPGQSLVFLCLALGASIKKEHIRKRDILALVGKVRVYGDDIILPVDGYEDLKVAMQSLQLKINLNKSFILGKFRESCGSDAYDGYDCTPVKPTTFSPDGPRSRLTLVEASNNLFKKGYWNASSRCLDLLPNTYRKRLRVTGPRDCGFLGVTSFLGSSELHLQKRWNRSFQCFDVRTVVIRSRVRKTPREQHHQFLDFLSQGKPLFGNRQASSVWDVADPKDRIGWEVSLCST
jgi:hypothetical protein